MKNRKIFWVGIALISFLVILNFFPVGVLVFDKFNIDFKTGDLIIKILLISSVCLFAKKEKQEAELPIGTKALILFAFFASYKYLYLYCQNITLIPFVYILIFTAGSFAIFFYFFFCFKYLLKNESDSIILSLTLVLLLSVDLKCFWIIFLIAFVVYNFLDTKKVVTVLKPFCAILLSISILSGLARLVFHKYNLRKTFQMKEEYTITKNCNRDIYIIVLDAYGGKRGLNSIGYDNSAFYKELRKKGFKVYENMESNYSQTAFSIPSFLNAKYLQETPYKSAGQAINNARILKIAKQTGYNIYYINSWTSEISVKTGLVDFVFESTHDYKYNILELFTKNTLIYFLNRYTFRSNEKTNRKFENTLNAMNDIIDKKIGKKFVFAHFLMPHHPYVYDENGQLNKSKIYNSFSSNDGAQILNKEGYIGFLKYTNKTVFKMLDKIFKESSVKPIIIIMGDHGLRPVIYNDDRKTDIVKQNYKYYFNTFIAYYNPDQKQENASNPKSHINFFINFLNENFGTKYENVEDKHYFVTNNTTWTYKGRTVWQVEY